MLRKSGSRTLHLFHHPRLHSHNWTFGQRQKQRKKTRKKHKKKTILHNPRGHEKQSGAQRKTLGFYWNDIPMVVRKSHLGVFRSYLIGINAIWNPINPMNPRRQKYWLTWAFLVGTRRRHLMFYNPIKMVLCVKNVSFCFPSFIAFNAASALDISI